VGLGGTDPASPEVRQGFAWVRRVEKFRSIEHLKARLTVVRWHLDAAALESGQKRSRHLDSASLTYQGALELLAQLPLGAAERAEITAELAQLKERLAAEDPLLIPRL
jgi:hypothetical protein